MTILDRYILRLFTKDLAICFFSLAGIFVVFDAFSNIDEFISYGEKQGGVLRVLIDYYSPRILALFDKLVGMLALMVAVFCITGLQRRNELTAIMAGGIPKFRVIQPLVFATVVVSLLGVVNREALIPMFRDKLVRNAQDWLGESAKTLQPRYDNVTDILFTGRNTVAKERRIDHPNLRLPMELGQYGRQLTADTATYQPAAEGRPSGYLLQGVDKPANLAQLPSALLDDKPVIFSPSDTPWLQPNQCFVASDMDFERLTANSDWQTYSSTFELIGGLRNPSLDYGADTRVMIHARIVQPILDVALLFVGLPLVLGRENRNVFVSAGHCMAAVAIFSLLVLTSHALGSNYLINPALAAWAPAMVMIPAAFLFSGPLWD